ncbi:MAG: hypothetical protein GX237_01035 [Clostridiales bacterium]|nr:hypothetical protein [Clostridiales bacterium]
MNKDGIAKDNVSDCGICDLHLIYPCSFDDYIIPNKYSIIDENSPFDNPYKEESEEEMLKFQHSDFFIQKLHDNSNYEFNDAFIKKIIRIPLGEIKCGFSYMGVDYYEQGFAYISKHTITEVGTFSIVFPQVTNPVTLELFSFCENTLNIIEKGKATEVSQWLKNRKIEICGYPKAVMFSYDCRLNKCDILKCLAFEMEPIGGITSKKLNEWANDNIAQYDVAEVFVSDRCMIEIRKDKEPNVYLRLKAQAVELFFIEILLFQEAAISRVCSRVSYHLNEVSSRGSDKNSFEILSRLSREMANAIMFIDHKRLRYPSVRISSEIIAERFGLPEELDKYYKYREILEDMINLNSNEHDKIESSLMNFLLLVLTMIQVIPTLKVFIDITMSEEVNTYNWISLIISLATCVLFYILYKVFRWTSIRKLSKNRSKKKKYYGKK